MPLPKTRVAQCKWLPSNPKPPTIPTAVINVLKAVSLAKTEAEAAEAALHTVCKEFAWAYGSYWKVDRNTQSLPFQHGNRQRHPRVQQGHP